MDSGGQSSLLLQKSIKDNTEELHDFLADLKSWEREMKEMDQRLASQSSSKDKRSGGEGPIAHPVRSRSHQGPAKSILKQTENNKQVEDNKQMESNKQMITSNNNKKKAKRLPCDYAAWDKFDVDKALESSSSSEEEVEHKQPSSKATPPIHVPPANKKERATALKEEGNKLYSKGRLEDAVAKYTQGMALDPTNPLLPANRAMAYIKLKKYTAAEADCNRCLKLDCDYIKGYLRRATARLNLGKEELARRDCLKVLEMEPGNKEAKRELEKLRGISSSQEENRTSTEQLLKNSRLGKEEKIVQNPPEVVREGVAVGKGNEQSEGLQVTSHKRKGNGKKMKIVEVNSSQEDKVPPKANQILPIVKPPHLRSKKPLRRIPVKDIGTWEDMNKRPVVEAKVAESSGVGDGQQDKDKGGKVVSPPKTSVLVSSKPFVPSVPKTSHQFSQDWHRLSNQAEAACEYIKMIPPAFFRTVDLETSTLVEVAEVLAREGVSPSLAAEHLSALSVSHGFSINLMFLEADQKQVFLNLTSKCQQVEGHRTKMEELKAAIQSS
uniref:RNA polymerase II-associated protein 3 n=1 Tax=Scylla olivacea TaxID=85551 RepID=A0A0P4WBG9_SCYOL